jgi:hypothetical protein
MKFEARSNETNMQRTLGSKCKGKKITMTWKEIEEVDNVLFKKPHHENIMPTMKNFQGHYQLAKF